MKKKIALKSHLLHLGNNLVTELEETVKILWNSKDFVQFLENRLGVFKIYIKALFINQSI